MAEMRRIARNGLTHEYTPFCDTFEGGDNECRPTGEVTPTVPEFTIEVSYQHFGTENGIFQNGWKYIIRWTDSKGQRLVKYEYGFATKASAKNAAEARAYKVVLADIPTETYKFTPGSDA